MSLENLKRINIADFAQERLGFVPERGGDSRLWRKLVKDGVKIWTCVVPGRSGHFLYGSSSFRGGTLIDLLKNLGWSDEQILNLDNCPPSPPKPFFGKIPDSPTVARWLRPLALETIFSTLPLPEKAPFPNFFSKRGLTEATRIKFGLSADASTTIFKLYILSKKGVPKPVSAIKYTLRPKSNKTIKRFFAARGSAINLLSPSPFQNLKNPRLYVFESPIDALSFYQIFAEKLQENIILVSTCGNPTHDFVASWPRWLSFLSPSLIAIFFDWDAAGDGFAKKLLEATPAPFRARRPKRPAFCSDAKDWNEYLLFSQNPTERAKKKHDCLLCNHLKINSNYVPAFSD